MECLSTSSAELYLQEGVIAQGGKLFKSSLFSKHFEAKTFQKIYLFVCLYICHL